MRPSFGDRILQAPTGREWVLLLGMEAVGLTAILVGLLSPVWLIIIPTVCVWGLHTLYAAFRR